jgi:hypothetical protein
VFSTKGILRAEDWARLTDLAILRIKKVNIYYAGKSADKCARKLMELLEAFPINSFGIDFQVSTLEMA